MSAAAVTAPVVAEDSHRSVPGTDATAPAQTLTYLSEPVTYRMAPPMYHQPQQMVTTQQYVQQHQAMEGSVQYADQQQPMSPEEQPMYEEQQPQYVTMDGIPCDVNGNPLPDQQMAPGGQTLGSQIFNISHEQFAILASGGSLSEADLAAITSNTELPLLDDTGAPSSGVGVAVPSSEKKRSKKKALGSKKKAKGCC